MLTSVVVVIVRESLGRAINNGNVTTEVSRNVNILQDTTTAVDDSGEEVHCCGRSIELDQVTRAEHRARITGLQGAVLKQGRSTEEGYRRKLWECAVQECISGRNPWCILERRSRIRCKPILIERNCTTPK